MSLLECMCCSRHQHSVAVSWDPCSGACMSHLTYSQLIQTSLELSDTIGSLVTACEWPGCTVGLYGECCPDTVVVMIGAMTAAVPYLPLPVHGPLQQRVEWLRENRVGVVIVQERFVERFLEEALNTLLPLCVLTLDCQLLSAGLLLARLEWKQTSPAYHRLASQTTTAFDFSDKNLTTKYLAEYREQVTLSCPICERVGSAPSPWPLPFLTPTTLAYILSTSGTTGEPVTVRVPHCCIVPNIVDLRGWFSCGQNDVIFNAAPLTFDPSVVEIFLALSAGATLLTVPEVTKSRPDQLARVLASVTVLQATPTLIGRFGGEALRRGLLGVDSKLRVLAFGGEKCPECDTLTVWRDEQNQTAIFNLYGLTEVSSWASCSLLPHTAEPVTLGNPLLGTKVEVRSEDGSLIQHGEGIIWAGGGYRVCVIGEETRLQWGRVRCTGDVGRVEEGGAVIFLGRRDRQVKRFGHRVNLDHIQQVIECLDTVESCVVTTATTAYWSQGSFRAHSQDNLFIISFVVLKQLEEVCADEESWSRLSDLYSDIFVQLRRSVSQSSVPDEIVFVKQIPLTQHGKADIKSLVSHSSPDLYLEWQPCVKRGELNEELLTRFLRQSVLQTTGLANWKCNVKLSELGVSSFEVVRLTAHFVKTVALCTGHVVDTENALFESLLTETLEQVVKRILSKQNKVCSQQTETRSDLPISENRKRTVFDEGSPVRYKHAKVEPVGDLPSCSPCETICWRGGKVYRNGQLLLHSFKAGSEDKPASIVNPLLKLSIRWRVNTGKCVDCSPLLAKTPLSEDPIVFIGSHSGAFLAIELKTGREKWRRQLPDRIESSACLSLCGSYVVVGCYDGQLYVFSVENGLLHWVFNTAPSEPTEGEPLPIKSSPCVDPTNGWVWFGSHDHHMYAVDIQRKSLLHKVYLGGGSCFASPCADSASGLVFGATLQGRIVAISNDTGQIEWTCQCPKPIFSSPSLCIDKKTGSPRVLAGCVDGRVYVVEGGKMIASLATGNAVFCTCCVVELGTQLRIMCGSHDKHLYCWNDSYKNEWKVQFDSVVYATPCPLLLSDAVSQEPAQADVEVCSNVHKADQVPLVCVCSSAGYVYCVSLWTGDVVGTLELPGAVFSSPVCFEKSITVGCRDDYVYCIDIELTQNGDNL